MLKKLAAAFLFTFIFSQSAFAQVALSVGVKEVYDDNVFLENGIRTPNAFVLNDAIGQDVQDGRLSILNGDSTDGKKNQDIISNLNVSASGSLDELSSVVKGGWNLGTGLLLFTDYSDYSRLTLDGLVDLTVRDSVIPKPFSVKLTSGITSQTTDVSVATGSSARSSQTWNTNLLAGINDYQVARETYLGLGYHAIYSKFLGQFVIGGNEDDRFKQQGSDYITNGLYGNLDRQFTQTFNSGFSADGGLTTFTRVDSNDADVAKNKSDLDRYYTNITWDTTYTPTKKFTLTTAVGANITSLKNQPDAVTQTIVNEDGSTTENVLQRDKTQSGLIYTFGADYKFEPGSSITLQMSQNRTADIDGDLVTYRNYSATLNKSINDRMKFILGSSFLQYSTSDSLSNGLDRYEGSASLYYALTQDTNIYVGYNYADQNSDDSSLQSDLLFRTQDYKSNRFYIGISSGIIGKKS